MCAVVTAQSFDVPIVIKAQSDKDKDLKGLWIDRRRVGGDGQRRVVRLNNGIVETVPKERVELITVSSWRNDDS